MKQWYEELFTDYCEGYERECFVQGTFGECDFIEKEICYDKGLKILDIGCGTGRHSIELTKRGYPVTGIDLSPSMLSKANEKASELKLSIPFIQMDARQLTFNSEFDLALMLCEGGFPLMETDEMNFQILQSAVRSLKPKGKFIFTTLNGLFPLLHSRKEFCEFFETNANEGNAKYISESFDLMTFRDFNVTTILDDHGRSRELHCNERYYVPSEISWLLKSLSMTNIGIFGAKLGAFSRNDHLTPDDFEMLVIAEKS